MIVLKFGGTSVRDAARIDDALAIAARQLHNSPVLVSSAFAGVTDGLIETADLAVSGDAEKAQQSVEEIRRRHLEALDHVPDGAGAPDTASRDTGTEDISSLEAEARQRIEMLCGELSSLVRGLSLLKECSRRTSDAVLAFGELLSTTVIRARAARAGIQADLVDSREFIQTDENFTAAAPDFERTNAAVKRHVKPQKGGLIIAQGFIGRAPNGATTTLGRGGSDYTATIIGAALGAREVQIWTDVNGIMTSDPRIVSEARTVNKISYDEAAELAYFGAKVVHPSTIQPAIEQNIPVLVKNTLDPDGPYTAIIDATYETGLRAIAGKSGITLINITSSRMLNAYGFLSRIFAVFERYRTPVDLIATSEVSVSVTIENLEHIDDIVRDLKLVGSVGVERGKGIVCLVGKDLWKDSKFVAGVFSALEDTQIRMISLGSSDINLSIVVQDSELHDVTRALHSSFFSAG